MQAEELKLKNGGYHTALIMPITFSCHCTYIVLKL